MSKKETLKVIFDDIDEAAEKFFGRYSPEPPKDLVEVVRCEDCVHCADDYVDTGFGAMPAFTCDLFDGYGVNIKPGHYCSYGERRSDD